MRLTVEFRRIASIVGSYAVGLGVMVGIRSVPGITAEIQLLLGVGTLLAVLVLLIGKDSALSLGPRTKVARRLSLMTFVASWALLWILRLVDPADWAWVGYLVVLPGALAIDEVLRRSQASSG